MKEESINPVRDALARLYAATVRAEATRVPISYDHFAMVDARAALAAQPAAPAQPAEPAAWRIVAHGRVQKLVVRADVADELACKWRDSDPDAQAHPLYATTPAPQPLTLTDEQIDAIARATSPTCDASLKYDERRTVWDRAFARAVLAAAEQKP
jgi:hypothetical protein